MKNYTDDSIYNASRDILLSQVGSKTSIAGGAFTGVTGVLSANMGIALIGVLLSVGGFIINWYFQKRRDQREHSLREREEARRQELHVLSVQKLKKELEKINGCEID